MALIIQKTGLEQYAPGGQARIKVLVIGGPGTGKTRWASYFPKPIYADCEKGLASVADRTVDFANIRNSDDMLDLLSHLKMECRKPTDKRDYETVVIDTLDAFQRKVKNEWMEKERKDAFTGWEAWGYMNQRMQLLLTRLLNLDMNVIVNVHYKDKTIKDDETGRETHSLMLQLQGETADTAFNDFDLVGFMGTYFEAENGERVQKRGLTFKPTPDKPFLKDRLFVTPTWLEVGFADSDYTDLFTRISDKANSLESGQTVGEIPSSNGDAAPTERQVVTPADAGSGALPPQPQREVPLEQFDKPTLARMARERGITKLPDGSPLRGNSLKAEYIAALKAAGQPAEKPAEKPASKSTRPADGDKEQAEKERRLIRALAVTDVPEGTVDTATGELVDAKSTEPDKQEAVKNVEDVLGGVVQGEFADAPVTPASPEPQGASAKATKPPANCEVCSKQISSADSDYVKLAWIKFRAKLCDEHYFERQKLGK